MWLVILLNCDALTLLKIIVFKLGYFSIIFASFSSKEKRTKLFNEFYLVNDTKEFYLIIDYFLNYYDLNGSKLKPIIFMVYKFLNLLPIDKNRS